MLRRLILPALLATASLLPAQQKPVTTLQLPPRPLLPMSFAGWTATAKPVEEMNPGNDPNRIGNKRLSELGALRASTATYVQGNTIMHLTAYEFADATGAYGFYAGGADGEVRLSGSETQYGDFRSGVTAVGLFVSGTTPHLKDDLESLSKTFPVPTGSKGQLPLLPAYLPKNGLAPATTSYAIGPESYSFSSYLPSSLIDFSRDAETLMATYTLHGNTGALLLIEYPTPQMAMERMQAFQNWLQTNKPLAWWVPVSAGTASGIADSACSLRGGGPLDTIPEVHAQKIQNCTASPTVQSVSLSRSGPIIALAAGYFSQKDADALAASIHYSAEVTLDKPQGYISDAWRAARLYLGIAALSGILCSAAVFFGLFFGGARAILRILQGKPASAAGEAEFISLDLGHGGDYRPPPPQD